MNGIISDGVAEEDRVAPADWRTRASSTRSRARRSPAGGRQPRREAPTWPPAAAPAQQEQRMRAVYWISDKVTPRDSRWTARRATRAERSGRRQCPAVTPRFTPLSTSWLHAWRDRKRWLAGADARAAQMGARLLLRLPASAAAAACVYWSARGDEKACELAGDLPAISIAAAQAGGAEVVQRRHGGVVCCTADGPRGHAGAHAATLLAARDLGRSISRAFGVARGASTRLAALSPRKVAACNFAFALLRP